MKKLIIMLAAVLSTSLYAAPENPLLSTTGAPTASTILSSLMTQGGFKGEAEAIIKEGQDFYQTGEMGIIIAKRVEELQEEEDMSDNEAIDILMERAQEILN